MRGFLLYYIPKPFEALTLRCWNSCQCLFFEGNFFKGPFLVNGVFKCSFFKNNSFSSKVGSLTLNVFLIFFFHWFLLVECVDFHKWCQYADFDFYRDDVDNRCQVYSRLGE